jgi:putative DNA primase/helicase
MDTQGFHAAGEPPAGNGAWLEGLTVKVTFGKKAAQAEWSASECKELTGPELIELFTTHQVGQKDGRCVVPGVLKGDRRLKDQVAAIALLVLDSDKGHTLEELRRIFAKHGVAAIISSTHSHMTTTTEVAESAWTEWQKANPGGTAADFMRHLGYLTRVYEGATRDEGVVMRQNKPYVVLRHAPCAKYRIVIPLAAPWTSDGYENGIAAANAWARLYLAAGRLFGLSIDTSCQDVHRLYYLPRRNTDAAPAETAVLHGRCLKLEELEAAAAAGPNATQRQRRSGAGKQFFAVDVNGEFIDLNRWVADGYADRFEAATAIETCCPDRVVQRNGSKLTIVCPFEEHHSSATRTGTFAVNASEIHQANLPQRKKGFFIGCSHNGCKACERDRLDFVAKLIEIGALTVEDLTNPEFLTEVPDDGATGFDLSHDGLALEMGYRWQNNARYVAKWGNWLFWNGSCWELDEKLVHMTRTREFLRAKGNDCKEARAGLRSAKTVAYVSGLVRSNPELVGTVGQWDSDSWVLNTPGGIVDLRTGELRPSDPSAYCTKATAVAPALVGTKAPIWQAFLERTFRHDPQLIPYMQRVLGYSLTGDTSEQALFFALGQGGNGKGVCLNTITALLGDYAAVAPSDMLLTAKGDRHSTDMAGLRGARLVTAQELDRGKTWDEPKIKSLTGGDPITARLMRQDFFTYVPQFKLIVAGNNKPSFKGVDEAIRRRLHLVPFLQNIPAEERDPALPAKLRAEWPAILRWCIEGCLLWQREGLNPPESVRQASEQYLNAEDVLGQWLEDCCLTSPRIEFCTTAKLYLSWVEWCAKTGQVAGSSKAFSQKLSERGFEPHKKHGDRGFKGITVSGPAHRDTKAEAGAKASGNADAFEFPDDDISDLLM